MKKDNKNTLVLNQDNIQKAIALFGDDSLSDKGAAAAAAAATPAVTETNVFKKSADLDIMKAFGERDSKINALELQLKKSLEINAKVNKFPELLKGIMNDFATFSDEANNLIKGLKNELNSQKELNTELEARVKKIEETPLPAKSLTKDFIKKSFNVDGDASLPKEVLEGRTVLHIKKDAKQISNLLGTKMQDEIQKSLPTDKAIFAQSAMSFEAKGVLSREVILALNKENIYVIND